MTVTIAGSILAHDYPHACDDLLSHWGRHGGGVAVSVTVHSQVIHQFLQVKHYNVVIALTGRPKIYIQIVMLVFNKELIFQWGGWVKPI